jgi:hypothetical protein
MTIVMVKKKVIPKQICVYTVLVGKYERLNEQFVAKDSNIPLICFTDDIDLKSESWEIRHVPLLFGMDSIRSQRELKLRPHVYLPEFKASIYIDNSVLLSQSPASIFEQYFPESGFSIIEHSYRNSVLDEFLEVEKLGLDNQYRIREQLNHYKIECPELLQEKPFWGAILIRDHKNTKVMSMCDIWAAHVHRYSRRDQLSVNVAFWKADLIPDVIHVDNLSSWFHSWSHIDGRIRFYEVSGTSIRELEQALAEKEQELTELQSQISELLASTSWRITAPMRSSKRMFSSGKIQLHCLWIKDRIQRFQLRMSLRR